MNVRNLFLFFPLNQEDMTVEEIAIDSRVHSRIIGGRGRGINKIMDEFKVDVKFPRSDSENPDLVVVMGDSDAVYDCRDHLLLLEEEYVSTSPDHVDSFPIFIRPKKINH